MNEFDSIMAMAYYAFLVFGSVTLGYAFLRLTQPEIRASPRRRKLLLSFAVGAAFAAVGIGADYASYGADRVLAANGLAPSFLFAAAAICLGVFKAASAVKLRFSSKRTMEVAVAAPLEKEGAARLLPFVQEVRKFEPVQLQPAAAPEHAPGHAPESGREDAEEKQFGEEGEVPLMEDIWTNKKIGGEEEKEKIEAGHWMKEPSAPPWVKQDIPPRQNAGGRDRSVRDKLSELKSKGVIEEMTPPRGGEEPAKEPAGKELTAKEDAEKEPAATAATAEPKIETPNLDTGEIELPELELPNRKEAGFKANAPQNKPESKPEPAKVFGEPRYAKKEAEAATEKTAEKTPEKTGVKEKTGAGENKGFLQKIFGGKSGGISSGKDDGRNGGIAGKNGGKNGLTSTRKPPSPGTTAVRLPPAPNAKGDEQEIEVILSELHLVAPPTPSAQTPAKEARRGWQKYGAGRGVSEPAAASSQEAPAQRHRLYLERRGGGSNQQSFAREQEEKQELTDLFSDVYAQVEKPGRPGAARQAAQRGAAARAAGAGGAGGAAAAGAAGADKGLALNDLFGGESKPVKNEGGLGGAGVSGSSVFAQLDNLDASGKAKAVQPPAALTEAIVPKVQVVKMRVDANAGCPHCGAKNVRVVFCPYCSTGMCANCTPNLKPTPEAFIYVCPKCGEEVPLARAKKT